MADLPLRVFVVDVDREMRDSLSRFLSKSGCEIETFAAGEAALERVGSRPPDVLVSDIRMPRMSGLDLLETIAVADIGLPVLLITAHDDVPMAVDAMKAGAFDFIEKPFQPDRLLDAIRRAAEAGRLRGENRRLRERLRSLSDLDTVLIGDSDETRRLRAEVEDVATTDAAVMILGETGTGKELVARALHDLGQRAGRPFVAVNCATISKQYFEPRLFGAEDGSKGVLAQADTGTLFLDELAACPPGTQAKLLRIVETQEFTPLSCTGPVHVDLRLLTASNEALDARIDSGDFRRNLYFRLNSVILTLPPLRDRGEDVVLPFAYFASNFAELYEVDVPEPSSTDIAALMTHDWPGNVRDCVMSPNAASLPLGAAVARLPKRSAFTAIMTTCQRPCARLWRPSSVSSFPRRSRVTRVAWTRSRKRSVSAAERSTKRSSSSASIRARCFMVC